MDFGIANIAEANDIRIESLFKVKLLSCMDLTTIRMSEPQNKIIIAWKHWKKFNSSLPGQNGRHFADNVFRCILLNENFHILTEISLKCVPEGPIDNNPALV